MKPRQFHGDGRKHVTLDRPPGFSLADQKRMQEDMEAQERADIAQKVERHFRAVGPLRRHGVFDTGCPKCGQATIGKVHCPGRDRGQTEGLECYVFGDHLHAQCGTCKFVWLEHAKDDALDSDIRGGVRFDETMVDGVLVTVAPITAAEKWHVGMFDGEGRKELEA